MICVDANVSAKWLFPEDYSPNAEALAVAAARSGEALVGPPHLRAEISNIIRQRMRQGELTLDQAQAKFLRFVSYGVQPVDVEGLYETALEIADRFSIDASYDAVYVALAQLLGADLWTDDRKLLQRLDEKLPFVRWIAEYPVA